ncbi:dipeptide/oligopeptide/nickel ABC transporter permease/ATP-binding protein [Nonomuraea sp. NPDC050328]|uniref:dipeptide/oligopeptide/nickel ABC transporter permease/ATP-binding protein n=1 Tax=Nonomuraea sp. NPDC050328 TaxID=3364361 RepID=UPI0037B64BCA
MARRISPTGLLGAALIAVVLLLAIAGPPLWGEAAARMDTGGINAPASAEHWFGTDALGRDVFARTMVAARLSLLLATLATLLGVGAGIVLGALPMVLGRRGARAMTTVVELLVAFPGLLLAMALAVVVGLGSRGAVLGLGCAMAPGFARLTQTLAASVAGSDYLAAAKVLGVGRRRRLTHYVLPNIAEPLILNLTVSFGQSLLALAGLSFLGLGVQAPEYDWGRLVSDGMTGVYISPMTTVGPAAAICVAALGFTLFGESLSQAASGRRAARGRSAVREHVSLPPEPGAVLRVEELTVTFPGGLRPVRGLSFTVRQGEIVGIVGESGSGKSLTASAVAGLVPHPGTVTAKRLELAGHDLLGLGERQRRHLLGTELAMVFQDPMSALNPALRVGAQLAEVATTHRGASAAQARELAVERLGEVALPEPARLARQYPHEYSGGMRQRAVIAMGLMAEPGLIVADEPTTALDVTVQRQILRLLREVTDGRAGVLISHDLAVVAQLCSRVLVMYAGRIVEELTVEELRAGPAHPYTRALLDSLPTLDSDRSKPLRTIPGRQPGPGERLDGCPFAPRCEAASDRCRAERPALTGGVACHHPLKTKEAVR